MRWLKTLALILCVAGANAGLWAALNRPVDGPGFTGKIHGAAWSPYAIDGDPLYRHPTEAQLRSDLQVLAQHVTALRTYSVLDGLDRIPALAAGTPLKFTLGAWVDQRKERSRQEIEALVAAANANGNVVRVLVGNEAVLRKDLTPAEIIPYIREVRSRVKQPVSIAEPWGEWISHPELADAVDFIAIHVLPYWEDAVRDTDGVAYAVDKIKRVQARFPGKPVVITEIGWPSGGRQRFAVTPTLVNEALFLRGIFNFATAAGIEYYVMEAIDQPWKTTIEASVGPHWGILDAYRQPKFPLTGPVEERPHWRWMMLGSVALALVPMLMFLRRSDHLSWRTQLAFLVALQAIANGAVWIWHVTDQQYLIGLSWVPWLVLLLSLAALALFFGGSAFDLAEVLGARRLRRAFAPAPPATAPRLWPFVSIHIPTYNEPPEMMKLTLDSLARLDYPNFEVIVVDNNTRDEATWRPVERHCAELNQRYPGRFRFFHVSPLSGFKAGALNYALERADPRAAIVGVVDSDYVVEPGWLKATVPHFDDVEVGFVQCPQDHRDIDGSPFKRLIGWEYAGFFAIGMVQRNERDAIIQHGTMVLLRKAAMMAGGGWATWCIVEDAEMGLRLVRSGYKSVYIRDSFGRGLMPDGFAGYKVQRFRWAYGAVQIMRRYTRDFFLPGPLTFGQRYHYIFGWTPWIADAASVVLGWLAVAWTALVILLPEYFVLPDVPFIVPVVAVFLFKLAETLLLYRARVPCTLRERLGAGIAGLGLTYTVGKAVLTGLLFSKRPFVRTPKLDGRPGLWLAVRMVREEAVLMVLLWASALATYIAFGDYDPESHWWSLALITQSLPYLAALGVSITATRSPPPGREGALHPSDETKRAA